MGKYTVLNRTVETTNAHVESDKSGIVEETWNDVSVSYDAYAKYDEVEVTTPDTSIDEDANVQVRHTHLNTGEKLSETIMSMAQYYLDNNLYPTDFFFKGDESKKDGPTYDLSDPETGINMLEAIYSESDNEKLYTLYLKNSNNEYPIIEIVTKTTSKSEIQLTDIQSGKLTLTENSIPEIIKSEDITISMEEDHKEGDIEYYHVAITLRTTDNSNYVVDAIMPVTAHEEDGTPINISEIDVVEPTEEEIALVDDILNALISGEIPEGETRFDVSTKGTTTTITINEGNDLTNIVFPEDLGQTIKINGPIKSGSTITYETPGKKTMYVNNTSEEPSDITLNSTGTIYLTGEYDDIQLNGTSLSASGTNYANIHGNLIISNDVTKSVNVTANFVGTPNNMIVSDTEQPITITAKNAGAKLDIECPNSTVTLGGGSYDEVDANVADETLKLTISTHINNLKLRKGNIFINNGKNIINDLVQHIECDYEYTVDYNKSTTLPSSPAACEYTLESDKNGNCTWSAIASGDTVIDLNGHNINGSTDRTASLYVRSMVHLTLKDSIGGGKVTNDKAYCIWNSGSTTVDIYGGEYEGVTHTVYCYTGNVNIYGGVFKMTSGDLDAHGNYKFLLNCYDPSFTAGTAIIKVYGGTFYKFNPAEAYGEPTQPTNYVAEGYKSVKRENEDIWDIVPE